MDALAISPGTSTGSPSAPDRRACRDVVLLIIAWRQNVAVVCDVGDGDWRLAVGGWRWRLAVAIGGWRLAVGDWRCDGDWRFGDWRVGAFWRLAVALCVLAIGRLAFGVLGGWRLAHLAIGGWAIGDWAIGDWRWRLAFGRLALGVLGRWRLAFWRWAVGGWRLAGWRFGDWRLAIGVCAMAIGDWRFGVGVVVVYRFETAKQPQPTSQQQQPTPTANSQQPTRHRLVSLPIAPLVCCVLAASFGQAIPKPVWSHLAGLAHAASRRDFRASVTRAPGRNDRTATDSSPFRARIARSRSTASVLGRIARERPPQTEPSHRPEDARQTPDSPCKHIDLARSDRGPIFGSAPASPRITAPKPTLASAPIRTSAHTTLPGARNAVGSTSEKSGLNATTSSRVWESENSRRNRLPNLFDFSGTISDGR